MLGYLHIRGLALLDDVALEFGQGMNVLTGETGAGKSIIVDALTLLRGARGRAELIRKGAEAARVEAQFALGPGARARVSPVLDELGVSLPEEEGLVVSRVIGRSGRGRSAIQATLTTVGVLEQAGELLIDICSQHEHHSLTKISRHRELLDAHAGLLDEVAAHDEVYGRWRESATALVELRARASEATSRAEFLRFQIDEIERVDPQPGELDALRGRITLLRDAHRWASFAHEARSVLYEDDDAIAARLASLLHEARRGSVGSDVLVEIQEQLAAAQVACEEAAAAASRFAGEVTVEPGELELAEERLHELERLRRKHAATEDELCARIAAMRTELEELEHVDDHLVALEQREGELRARCEALARKLTERRKAAAKRLTDAVVEELRALHIPGARLEVEIVTREGEDGRLELGLGGADRVEFRFSANLGEPAMPLTKVASGGELSRVLLAMKGVLATGDHVATYVFDEVDAGVGGAVAEAIGRRLHRASRERQVLCITHLPQIAAFADTHFRVEKRTVKGRTTTRVVQLDEEARVEELARMLGGARITDSAREHASQLLAEARAASKTDASRPRARARPTRAQPAPRSG
ncbi:MAG: DNA repair protein RecN [Myxococcales bacterium]|nr:DNA repair protein RecN [Myxococcales bacterium]